MDETNDPQNFLEGLDEAIGEVYADLYAAVDRAIEQVDELMDTLRSFLNVPKGVTVKVEPSHGQMLLDLYKDALERGKPHVVFSALIESLDNGMLPSESNVNYIKTLWEWLDEDSKSYVERSPDSPL